MANRRKPREKSGLNRNQSHAVNALASTLIELKHYAELFDTNTIVNARTTAMLLLRLLDDELTQCGIRRECLIHSFGRSIAGNLSPCHWLTSHKLFLDGKPRSQIVPILEPIPELVAALPIEEWMNEIIIEGPKNDDNGLDLGSDRFQLSRRRFLRVVRDETGAHFERSVSLEHLMSFSNHSILDFATDAQDGREINTREHPKEFPTIGDHGNATIRTIAQEILTSFRLRNKNGAAEVDYFKIAN